MNCAISGEYIISHRHATRQAYCYQKTSSWNQMVLESGAFPGGATEDLVLTTQSYHYVNQSAQTWTEEIKNIYLSWQMGRTHAVTAQLSHIHFGTAVFPKLMIDRTHFHQPYCVKHLLWMRLVLPMNCGQKLHRESITLMEYGQILEKIRTHKTVATWQRAQTHKFHFVSIMKITLKCSKKRQRFLMWVGLSISTYICIALHCDVHKNPRNAAGT